MEKTFQDTPENRQAIRASFNRSFIKEELAFKYGEAVFQIPDESLNNLAGDLWVEKINAKTEMAESIFFKIFEFLMVQVDRITYFGDGEKEVKKEDMPRYLKVDDLEFFKLGLDELAAYFQAIVVHSQLNEEDWDLDMINNSKKIFSAEMIKFDKSVTVQDVVKEFYK
jgi:hypothetical protein